MVEVALQVTLDVALEVALQVALEVALEVALQVVVEVDFDFDGLASLIHRNGFVDHSGCLVTDDNLQSARGITHGGNLERTQNFFQS